MASPGLGRGRGASQPVCLLASLLLCLWLLLAALLWPRTPLYRGRITCAPVERVVWCSRVVTKWEGAGPGFVHIDARGKLQEVRQGTQAEAEAYAHEHAIPVETHRATTLSPGVVDARVWFSAVGRAWEGYAHGTRAAVAGGVTTVVDMPFGSVTPADDRHALQLHMRAAATDRLAASVGFYAGLSPAVAGDALALLAIAHTGALGFVAVMSPAHEETGAEALAPDRLRSAAETAARANLPLLVRAEQVDEGTLRESQGRAVYEFEAEASDHVTHYRTREGGGAWQAAGLEALAGVAEQVPGLRLHAWNVARADEAVREAIAKVRTASHAHGGTFTADTAPHYLTFDAFSVRSGDTRLKAEPPIADEAGRESLWAALRDGTLDSVASDHAPCPDALRAGGNFLEAWAGVSGLGFALQATWTEARARGFGVEALARWLSERPAEVLGLAGRKGAIERGADADLVLWDPNAVVRPPHAEHHRLPGSPYVNRTLHGAIEETLVMGVPAFSHGHHTGSVCGAVVLGPLGHTAGATWT